MGLMKCPECTKEISSQAKICPNCGFHVYGVKNPLFKLLKPIYYKTIPKENVSIGGTKFVLPFHKAMYTYCQRRFNFFQPDKNILLEFYATIGGSVTQVREINVDMDFIIGKNKEERILAVFDLIQSKVYHDKLASGKLKIVNKYTFHNGSWRGGVMELVGNLADGSAILEADVIFGVGNYYMAFVTYASKTVDGVDPAVVYQENLRFLKLCTLPSDSPAGILKAIKNDEV